MCLDYTSQRISLVSKLRAKQVYQLKWGDYLSAQVKVDKKKLEDLQEKFDFLLNDLNAKIAECEAVHRDCDAMRVKLSSKTVAYDTVRKDCDAVRAELKAKEAACLLLRNERDGLRVDSARLTAGLNAEKGKFINLTAELHLERTKCAKLSGDLAAERANGARFDGKQQTSKTLSRCTLGFSSVPNPPFSASR